VGGFAEEERTLGAFGEIRRHLAQEVQLVGIELGLVRLAVEAEHAPRLARLGSQGHEQLLIGSVRTQVRVPGATATRVATRRLVQRRDPPLRTSDVGHLVEVVLVVLVREPLRGEFRDLGLVMARGQQRGRVEGEPAGRHVVGHGGRDDIARLAPERHEVQALTREPCDPLPRALLCIQAHGRMLRPPAAHGNTIFLEETGAPDGATFLSP